MIFRIVLALAYVRRSLTRYAEAAAGPRLKSRIGCFLALRKSARYGRVLRGKGRRCGLGAAVWRAALKTWTLKNALHGVMIMGDALHFLSGAEKNRDSLAELAANNLVNAFLTAACRAARLFDEPRDRTGFLHQA